MKNSGQFKELEAALFGVIAAITQTPSSKVKKARMISNIATAKATSLATSAGIFGLVSTLGTAGTGTAIGGLSGAAATNATLAWIGGLVGGGMAAGALLLPAAGIAAGATASMVIRKKVHGRPRKLDELLPFEDEILFCADNLLRPLEDYKSTSDTYASEEELRIYARDGLANLLGKIQYHLTSDPALDEMDEVANANNIGFRTTLKSKYCKQLHKHSSVISRYVNLWSKPKRKSFRNVVASTISNIRSRFRLDAKQARPNSISTVVLAVTLQQLLRQNFGSFTSEQDLVFDALRRSTKSLKDANAQELSEYIRGLTPEQLRGVASNTKGIYHELLFLEAQNSSLSNLDARLMEDTNHPGADIEFYMEGEVVREVQLKATSSAAAVHEHLNRYPDIEILVTEEMAAILDGIGSSGLSNAALTRNVSERLSELQGEGLVQEITDELITSAFVVSSVVAYRVLSNKVTARHDLKHYLSNAGIAVGTSSLISGVAAAIGN